MMPNFSFGMALTTYSGQNVGAGLYDRVTKGAKQGTLMAVGCSTVITGIILLFGKYLMMIFTDTVELVDLSVYIMRIHGTFVNFLDLSPAIQQDIITRLDPESTSIA